MTDKCVVCEGNPRVGDWALCAECDKSYEETEFGDIEWAASRARDVLKKEIREILKYWENEKRPDNALMALHDISEFASLYLFGYFEEQPKDE
jgi:hypothetical protein